MAKFGEGCMTASLRLAPRAQVLAGAGEHVGPTALAPIRSTQSIELHVQRRRLCVAGALAVNEQLLDDAREELQPRLFLARSNQHGAADLVQDGRGTLFQRRVDG